MNTRLKNYQYPDQFGKWLGYNCTKAEINTGHAVVELEIREDHLSPAGRVHGGVMSSLFDYACGAAVFTTLENEDFCSTVELKINYLKPANLGDGLRAETDVVFRGKRLSVVHGRLYRKQDSTLIAMVTATFNIVSPH